MVNYLTIISRADFSNLYKYGHIFVHNMVPFDGKLSDHADDKYLFDAVTTYMDTYEYATEYILLHVYRTVFSTKSVEIFVRDIVGVYALDEDSKTSLAASLDSRINIQVSAWTPFFVELNKRQAIRQSKAGEYNCFEIFQITNEERKAVNRLIPNGFVEELYNDLYGHIRPSGNRSLWNYLIRYERHQFYWNDIRGFFSDAIHVYENFRQKNEIDYEIADEVPLADVIGSCGTEFIDIYVALRNAQGNDYQTSGCNYFAVAPLFLYLKSYFREGGITPSAFSSNEFISDGKLHDYLKFDFALAVALLGISLGHDLTYSCYYQIKNLGIFNQLIESKINTQIKDPETGQDLTIQETQGLVDALFNEVKKLREDNATMEERLTNISTELEDLKSKKMVNSDVEEQYELDTKESNEQEYNEQPDNEEKAPVMSDEQDEQSCKVEENVPLTEKEQDADLEKDGCDQTVQENPIPSEKEETVESIQDENIVVEQAESPQDGGQDSLVNTGSEGAIHTSSVSFPILMKKLNSKGNKFLTGRFAKEEYAHNEKEYKELRRENFAPEDYLDDKSLFNNLEN